METTNPQAFHLATEALRALDNYVSSEAKPRESLDEARRKFREAVQKDPNFLRARYYGAIVDDMLGHPKEATVELEKLLQAAPEREGGPEFRSELQYNLGVAYYHVYYEPEMGQAIDLFSAVRDQTKKSDLKLLANAGLARALSMMVLHRSKEPAGKEAQAYYERALGESEAVLGSLDDPALPLDKKIKKEIAWRVRNGRGVAHMFHSDLLTDADARKLAARKALEDFEAADRLSPNNWEIVCNLGSVYMRLAKIDEKDSPSQSDREFEKALRYLNDVVTHIRPNYGFAYYEMGRVYRIRGDFGQAETFFKMAKALPVDERNVGDRTLVREMDAAHRGDKTFPLIRSHPQDLARANDI